MAGHERLVTLSAEATVTGDDSLDPWLEERQEKRAALLALPLLEFSPVMPAESCRIDARTYAARLDYEPWPELPTMIGLEFIDPVEHGLMPLPGEEYYVSPSGKWVLARVYNGNPLVADTFKVWGRHGIRFAFSRAVPILGLYARDGGPDDTWRCWMSMWPSEVWTQWPGVQLAQGTVVVAGLGLGWLLVAVARRPEVERIILVEQDQEIIDLILPRVADTFLQGFELDVICGDALEVMPTLDADVGLVDIWPSYGAVKNVQDLVSLRRACHNIDTLWGWGVSEGMAVLRRDEDWIQQCREHVEKLLSDWRGGDSWRPLT